MSHLRNLAKLRLSSVRGARSTYLTGTSRPWFLARISRTMFTTSLRSSVEPNQEKKNGSGGFEPPRLESLPNDDIGPPKVVYPFMLTLGLCIFSYTAYNVYALMTTWPEVLRDDLRKGLKYRNQHNLPLSIQHLQNAWETVKTLPLETFGHDPLLKTTGIAIVLAGVLEDDGKKEEAYKIYKEALRHLQSAHLELPPPPDSDSDSDSDFNLGGMENLKPLSPPERLRAAALSHRLGCLASELKKPEKEEEKWLVWSVNAIIMTVMEAPAGEEKVTPRGKNLHIMGGDMRLPSWATDHDFAAPFAALGSFYADRGNSSYALPLFLQAVSILIPPPPSETSPEDRCRGARIMRNISMLIAMSNRPEAIAEASAWNQKGLDVVNTTRQSHKGILECDLAEGLLLFNLAFIQLISGEPDKAEETLKTAWKVAKDTKMKLVAKHAQEELDKLDSKKIEDKLTI